MVKEGGNSVVSDSLISMSGLSEHITFLLRNGNYVLQNEP